MRELSFSILIIIFLVSVIGCDPNTDSNGNNGESETPTYQLTTSVSPSDAGTVSPDSEKYDDGEEITVEAMANEGWEFSEWTGDKKSANNPFSFKIENDVELTANFTEIEAPEYQLTVAVNPTDGGSVDPSNGTYQEGSELEIEATPSEGWSFVEWTGDVSSRENPLTVTMDSDKELTVHFEQNSSSFGNILTVSDGSNSFELEFGMDTDATAGFDSGIDEQAPPPPPSGAFYTQFVNESEILIKDFRSVTGETVAWQLEFVPEEGEGPIELSWDFSQTEHVGTLILTDDTSNPSVEVDMKSQSSYEVSDSSVQSFYIISN